MRDDFFKLTQWGTLLVAVAEEEEKEDGVVLGGKVKQDEVELLRLMPPPLYPMSSQFSTSNSRLKQSK